MLVGNRQYYLPHLHLAPRWGVISPRSLTWKTRTLRLLVALIGCLSVQSLSQYKPVIYRQIEVLLLHAWYQAVLF